MHSLDITPGKRCLSESKLSQLKNKKIYLSKSDLSKQKKSVS